MVAAAGATGRRLVAVHGSGRGVLLEAVGGLVHVAQGKGLSGVGRVRCAALAAAWGGVLGKGAQGFTVPAATGTCCVCGGGVFVDHC